MSASTDGVAQAAKMPPPARRIGLSLQQKAWLLTIGVLALLAGSLGVAVDSVFRRASAELESDWVAECVRRTQAALAAEIDALERSARDYSMWTDTYAFVVDGNERYIENNLLPSMFANLQLDAFLIYNAAGEVRLARTHEGGVVSAPGTGGLVAALRPYAIHAAARPAEPPPKGLLEVDGQLVLFAMLPVLRDDGSGPARGGLAHVRNLGPERVGKLRATVNLDLALSIPRTNAPAAASTRSPAAAGAGHRTSAIDDAWLRAIVPLIDVEGREVGAWQLTLPREIHQHGVRTRMTFYILLSVLIVAAAALIGWLLRSMVIARLEALHAAVQRVGSTADLSVRLPVRGADELTSLTDGLNRMLAALEQGEAVRLAAERERERLNAQLQEAQKMEAIGTLAGGLAHDFNNLLMSIQGAVVMLRADCPGSESAERNLLRIEKAAQHATRLVRQMMAFSRRSPTAFRTVALSHVVRDALSLIRASLPRQVTVEVDHGAEHDLVRADAAQLQQVLMNLATNASHAMAGEGGKLTFTLRNVRLPQPDVDASLRLPAGQYVRISVSDTGCGIPPEHLGRVFEPFYTTKPVGSGTGLGLAVAHGIVTAHGGAIAIESRVGVGTVVHLHLPVATEEPGPAAAVPGPTGSGKLPEHRKLRLLVVDDDVLVRETLESGARRLGYDVVLASGATEALRLFDKNPQRFDVVITDQLMPGMTGLELGDWLRKTRPDIPLILITGYAAAVNAQMVKARGFSAMLLKPVSMETLDQAIQSTAPCVA